MYLIDATMHYFDTKWRDNYIKGRVSAIIPVYGNKVTTLKDVISVIYEQKHPNIEIVIANNGIDGNVLNKHLEGVKVPLKFVHSYSNLGAAFGRNSGAMVSTGEFLWFIDSDIIGVVPGTLDFMLTILKTNNSIGAIGGQILCYPNRKVLSLGRYRDFQFEDKPERYFLFEDEYVNTTCMMVRRVDFHFIQGFADVMEYMHEDADFGFKLRRLGLRCIVDHRALALHPEAKSPLDQTDTSRRPMVYKNIFLYYLFNLSFLKFIKFIIAKRKFAKKSRNQYSNDEETNQFNEYSKVIYLLEILWMFKGFLILLFKLHKLIPLLFERYRLLRTIDNERKIRNLPDLSNRYVFGFGEYWDAN